MTSTTLIRGGRVLRRHDSTYRSDLADVVVEGRRIREITTTPVPERDVDQVVDASGRLVMPGLVNAHTHSYGNLARGVFDALPLEAWAAYATAVTLRRTWEEGYVSAMLGIIECVKSGTTSVLDHLAGSVDAQAGALMAYQEAGLRVTLAPMITDLPPHETVSSSADVTAALRSCAAEHPVVDGRELIAQQRSLLREWHGDDGLVSIALGPSGPQRCSDELLRGCANLAREFDAGLHTHLLETRSQRTFARSRYGRSMVAQLDDLGLLSGHFSGAHAVWCTDEDLRIIAASDATLVHNPWSNLTLGSGIAPVRHWNAYGVKGALGTDGANCGGNQNMFEAMHLAAVLHRDAAEPVEDWTTPDQVLRMATEGSAHALHLSSRIGQMEPGYEADLVILDLSGTPYVPGTDIVKQMVLGENGGGVETVMVGGRIVLHDRQLLTIDEAKIRESARSMLDRITARNADLLDAAGRQERLLLQVSRAAHAADTQADLASGPR